MESLLTNEVIAERRFALVDAEGREHEIRVLLGRPRPFPTGSDTGASRLPLIANTLMPEFAGAIAPSPMARSTSSEPLFNRCTVTTSPGLSFAHPDRKHMFNSGEILYDR